MMRSVRTTSLEMHSPDALRPPQRIPPELLLLRVGLPSPEFGRFLYTAVGGRHYWRDRLTWSYDRWLAWLSRPEIETWVAHDQGTPAGYFELERQPPDSSEIAYFGVLPAFTGRGLGGYLLSQAVGRAWRLAPGIARVWVHTCSLDHPGALPNYLARGFTVFKQEDHMVDLPDQPPGAWPTERAP